MSRIEGHDEWLGLEEGEYVLVIDQTAVGGDHDTTGYTKGYILRFEDVVLLDEDSPNIDNLQDRVAIMDSFLVRKIPVLYPAESVGVKELFSAKIIPVLSFVDSVQTADSVVIPTRLTLSFTDAVDIVDRDLACQE